VAELSWWQRYVWAGRAVQARQQLTLDQLLAEEGRPTAAGEPVTTDSALRLSTVWGCVRLLADSVATLPLHAYRGEDRDPLPTPALLRRPSADFDELSDWLWAIMASLLLRGNCWGVITARAGAGLLPAQVDLVHPDRVAVTLEDGRWVVRIGGKEYDRSELFHVKAYPFPGSPLGLSPVAYARESIGLGLAAERYGGSFFGNNGMPIGVLSTDQPIREDDAERIKARWEQQHYGKLPRYPGLPLRPQQRGIAVLGSGARFQAVTIAPEEAQFIETQKFNVSTIARFYGIAPEMVGGESAGHMAYSSPEMRSTDFLQFTLRPWLHRIERAVSGLLPSTQAAKFNAGGMVRATLLDRYQAHEIALRAGFLTVNEVRELEDRPPLPAQPARPLGAVA
jgi:HK97 family phage portal protein